MMFVYGDNTFLRSNVHGFLTVADYETSINTQWTQLTQVPRPELGRVQSLVKGVDDYRHI